MNDPAHQELIRLAAVREMWLRGNLDHLLDETQLEIRQFLDQTSARTIVVEAARQLGKSFLALVICVETCLRVPNGRVNFVSKTYREVLDIANPSMNTIITDAPPSVRPTFHAGSSRWRFPNGAELVLVGADDTRGADRSRGTKVILNVVDEAAFIDILDYLLYSVLFPQTRRTGARTILVSTPPLSPGHAFCSVADNAVKNGAHILRDIWSPGRQSRAEKEAYIAAVASSRGLSLEKYQQTSEYRREYMCERVIDDGLSVVPEFSKNRAAILKDAEVPRPPFYDTYFSVDPGMNDNTGILSAHVDFNRARLVITGERLFGRGTTQAIAKGIESLHQERYSDQRLGTIVVDDPHGRLCEDLWEMHQIRANPAKKDDRDLAVNLLNMFCLSGKLEIERDHCPQLIRQLGNAIRAKNGEMARSASDGHYDLVDTLIYLVRSVDMVHNPYPSGWMAPDPMQQAFRPKPIKRSLGSILSLSRSRR